MDGRRVAVIGGGDVAIDAARSALRLGADKVTLVYRRTRAEMPAHEAEIAWAEQEGVEMSFLLVPQRIVGNGRVTGLECLRSSLGDFDDSGRRRPVPVADSEFVLEADTIVAAIGQAPAVPEQERAVSRKRGGSIDAPVNDVVTNLEGVFAAGDAVSGPATVIQAIAQGERAAVAIDRYLRGESMEDVILIGYAPPTPAAGDGETDEGEVEEQPRASMPSLPAEARCQCFAEVELGFDRETAMAEAGRCLHCDRS